MTTTAPEDESLTERSLSDGGLLLLRLGVALIAAFLAGAVTQRIWLGRYAIKIGTLELSEVGEAADASKEAIAALRESLEQQIAKLKDAMDKEFTDQDETARASLQSVHASMTDLYAGLNDLRKRAG